MYNNENKGNNMLITTIDHLQGKRITEVLGIVQGSTVRSRAIGKDIVAVFKMLWGREVSEYTNLLSESRQQALDRMQVQAEILGANCILGVRFENGMGRNGENQILAYGTAVKIK